MNLCLKDSDTIIVSFGTIIIRKDVDADIEFDECFKNEYLVNFLYNGINNIIIELEDTNTGSCYGLKIIGKSEDQEEE